MHQRIHVADMMLECLLLANNGLPGHVAGTSAYPPTSDIRWPMSVIVLISSALPPCNARSVHTFGSTSDSRDLPLPRLLLGVEPTKSAR